MVSKGNVFFKFVGQDGTPPDLELVRASVALPISGLRRQFGVPMTHSLQKGSTCAI
jgi:hypothetical protein